MKLKAGVKLTDLSPQMGLGAVVVAFIYLRRGAVCTITSGNDGTHIPKSGRLSRHGLGNACDFRTKDYAGDKHALAAEIKVALGADFDVEFEHEGADNEHLHVEYDPKEIA